MFFPYKTSFKLLLVLYICLHITPLFSLYSFSICFSCYAVINVLRRIKKHKPFYLCLKPEVFSQYLVRIHRLHSTLHCLYAAYTRRPSRGQPIYITTFLPTLSSVFLYFFLYFFYFFSSRPKFPDLPRYLWLLYYVAALSALL